MRNSFFWLVIVLINTLLVTSTKKNFIRCTSGEDEKCKKKCRGLKGQDYCWCAETPPWEQHESIIDCKCQFRGLECPPYPY